MAASGRVSAMMSLLRRPTDDLVHATFLVLASGVATLATVTPGVGGATAIGLGSTFFEIVLVLGSASWSLRALSGRRLSVAVSLVVPAAVLGGWLAADRLNVILYGSHLDFEHVRLAVGRLVERRHLSGVMAGMLALCGALAIALRLVIFGLSFLPRRTRTAEVLTALRAPALAMLTLWLAFEPRGLQSKALPWRGGGGDRSPRPTLDQTHPFDASEERRMFAALERDRDRLLGAHLVAARRPSVVIVHVEALRRDMLREDVMPTLVRLSRTCLSPARHFSTSNNTASSMFGILNAMPVSYQRLALQDHAKSLPLQILKKLGYTRSAYYGAAIPSYHVLRDVFFDGVIDRIHEQQQAAADQGDAALVDEYVAEVARRDPAQPTFDYFVIESSHFPYSYPPAFEKLTPTVELGVDVAVSDPREVGAKLRNRYMNAVSWVDSLIDRLARAWNARKGDVVLIVLGDHGESFWEHRAFGHGSSLYDQEVLVPFAMCIPGIDHTRYTYSSHTDIFPTLFDFMGLSGVDVPFRAGKSLLRYDATRDIAIVGYGVNGSEPDLRLGVEGKGLRVVYLNERPFTTISVARDDVELGAPLPADVEASVADLKLFAAAARALR